MFYKAPRFNSDLSGWDVSNVGNMRGMFSYADAFDQNLGPWYITLNSTRIGSDGTYAAEITAQSTVLRDLSPYSHILADTDTYPDNANFTLSNDNILTIKPNVPAKAMYLINIKAAHSSLGTDNTRQIEITTASLSNRAPSADAGADLAASEGATVNLDGFSSSDPDGDEITYDWTISPSVALKNADTPAPSFAAPSVTSDTTYTLTLAVSDGTDAATDTVAVTVQDASR